MSFFSSLRARLLLLALLVLLPASGLLLRDGLEERRLDIEEAKEETLRLVRITASQQGRLIDSTEQILVTLAELAEHQFEDEAACSQILAELRGRYRMFANFGFIQPDGYLVCSGLPSPGPLYLGDRSYFQEALATRRFSGGEYLIGRITGRPTVNFGYPVLDDDDRLMGVVYAALDPAWLNGFATVLNLPDGATMTVIDQAGTIIAHYPDPEDWVGHKAADASITPALLARAGEGTVESTGLDGITRVFAFAPLFQQPNGSAYVSIGVPSEDAVARTTHVLTTTLAGLAFVAVLALAAAWVFAQMSILNPVASLLGAANRLAAGDLAARSGLLHAPGEIHQLARAFDEMGEALQAREAEAEQAHRLLREQEEQLRQAQKMESIGRLAGGIAHDFNNLLTAMMSFSEIVRNTLDKSDPRHKQLDHVLQAGERGASLVRQLLAFSRQQPLQPAILDLNVAVTNVEKLLGAMLGKDITIQTILEPNLGVVEADPSQIDQILLNLAVNARDAMPQGGEIIFETGNVEVDEAFSAQHRDLEPGPYVMLGLADTGHGMDAETRAHIFEPFFTTKGDGRGTGLGLSTVYGIVKQSSGAIWVYSEPGRGTTFKIYLPRVSAAASESARKQPPAVRTRGQEKILLVDDDAQVRELAATVLGSLGYDVVRAGSGVDALAMLGEREGPIDLLVTDLVMPGMSGTELAQEVLHRRPQTKVLYMSGFTLDAVARHRAIAGGVFLEKPFGLVALAQKVREVLGSPVPAVSSATA